MRAVATTILAIFSIWIFIQPAFADKRVALVIGNSAYTNVNRLKNPANDAAAVVAMLKTAGFDAVDLRQDLNVAEMRRALREFGNKTRDADVAVIYYAGHGIELDGTNYLIPVDATLETDTDVYDETFALDRVLVAVEPAKQLRLVILDACRDNPFAKIMKRTIGSRAIGRGLAKVEPSSPNTMIAFAAKAGATASVDQDATMRRDYEFALQIATKPVWDSFINKYSSGFYTDLAKAQRDKLAAEAARIEATSKAKAAQEEQARLAIEGAKAAEQTKAAEQAKAAEKARVAAELAK